MESTREKQRTLTVVLDNRGERDFINERIAAGWTRDEALDALQALQGQPLRPYPDDIEAEIEAAEYEALVRSRVDPDGLGVLPTVEDFDGFDFEALIQEDLL